jgi:nucleotidyltransferase substrate binding protein (TIGR01987 family)
MSADEQDIRWRQRFNNFEKTFVLFQESIEIDRPSKVERAGLIQFFEMAFEVAWKLLKDYLTEEGFMVKSPRAAIKQAFQAGLISDGHTWLEALEDRNLTEHTYEETTALAVEAKIRAAYFPILAKLYQDFKQRVSHGST